jgi:hypothetical protein
MNDRERDMGKRAISFGLPFLLSVVMSLPVAGRAQTRVDNPARAVAKNAGRVVRLEEVLRIRDDGDTAIFRSPRFFKLGPDGSLFFVDFAEGARLYRYSPDGKLVQKFLKTGQGPGECQYTAGYVVAEDRVRVLAWAPPKVMDFGPDGRYLRESRVEEDSHGLWFLGIAAGKIYGIRDELFSSAAYQSAGVFTIPNGVYEISADFKSWRKLYEFPVRRLIKKRNAFRLDPIDAAIRGTTLYILHTAEYRVTELDLRSGGVKRFISRAYDRVKGETGKPADPDPETRGVEFPDDPYVWDIDKIHAAAGKLWVFTSVMKPDGDDHQVDVFDADGRYVDSVILRFPAGDRNHRAAARWTLMTDDGLFIVPEQEADGLVSIAKYRIPDASLFPAPAVPKRST